MDITLQPGLAHGFTTCFTLRPHENCSEENSLHMPTTKLWNRLKPDQSDMIFKELNEWLSTISEDVQRELFYQYMIIHSTLTSGKPRDEIDEALKQAIFEIHSLIDHEQLDHWVRNYCPVYIQKEMEREYSGTYELSTTYVVDEYYDLVTLHFYFKLLAPIWPAYLNRYQTDESQFKELHAYHLLDNSPIHDLKAMDRLKVYARGMVESQGARFMPTIVKSLSIEEIPEYFMSRLVTRCLSVGHINDPDAPLHIAMFRHISSLNKTLQAKLRPKTTANVNGQEDDSIADSVRISEDIGDEHVVIDEIYLLGPIVFSKYTKVQKESYEQLNGDLIAPILRDLATRDVLGDQYDSFIGSPEPLDDLTLEDHLLDMGEILKITEMLQSSSNFDIAPHHHIILALVLDDFIEIRNLPLIQDIEAVHCAIATVAVWLMNNGYAGLGAALISETVPAHAINEGGFQLGGVSLKEINKDLVERMAALYPHVQLNTQGQPIRTGGSYGEIMINQAVDSFIDQPFTNADAVPSSIRNDLAELLLRFNEKGAN